MGYAPHSGFLFALLAPTNHPSSPSASLYSPFTVYRTRVDRARFERRRHATAKASPCPGACYSQGLHEGGIAISRSSSVACCTSSCTCASTPPSSAAPSFCCALRRASSTASSSRPVPAAAEPPRAEAVTPHCARGPSPSCAKASRTHSSAAALSSRWSWRSAASQCARRPWPAPLGPSASCGGGRGCGLLRRRGRGVRGSVLWRGGGERGVRGEGSASGRGGRC